MTIRLPSIAIGTALAVLPLAACVTSSHSFRAPALQESMQRALQQGSTSPAVKDGCDKALNLLVPKLPAVVSVLNDFSGPPFGIFSFGSDWLSSSVVVVGNYRGLPTLYYQDGDLLQIIPIRRDELATISQLLSESKSDQIVTNNRLHQSCHLVLDGHGRLVPVTLSDDPASQRASDKAVLLIDKIVESAPNSSFKPKPLRGSA